MRHKPNMNKETSIIYNFWAIYRGLIIRFSPNLRNRSESRMAASYGIFYSNV